MGMVQLKEREVQLEGGEFITEYEKAKRDGMQSPNEGLEALNF